MKQILITGASGYIGSRLAQVLIQKNFKVRLIDNYYIPSNITEIEGVPIERLDIRTNWDTCKVLNPKDFDIIVHLAAVSGIRRCNEDQDEAYSVNVKGTYNLLRASRSRIIFPSTSAVYGVCQHPEITEEHPTIPRSFYGETKLEGEKIVQLHDDYVILRFSNIYGHGLFTKRTVTDMFIERALKRAPLEIHGDGRQRRDFVHINDVIQAYWIVINSGWVGTYNIGGNEALNINDIAELTVKNYRKVFGYTLETKHIPIDVGTKWKDFDYSSAKAKIELSYEPSYSVNDEIREHFNVHSKLKK